MWIIQECKLSKLKTENGELRAPVRKDWEYTDKVFKDRDTAEQCRIELYKRGDAYYRVVKQSF